MTTRVFDVCLPCASDPRLFHFHYVMFHGILEDGANGGPFRLSRNAFYEAPVILPSAKELLVSTDVFQRLAAVSELTSAPVTDEFVFSVPYRLGGTPKRLAEAAPWIEKDIHRRDRTMLPPANSVERNYVALEVRPIRRVNASMCGTASVRHPSWNRIKTDRVVRDEDFLRRAGIVWTRLGYQVSSPVWQVLAPLVPWPFFGSEPFEVR
ncbi:MAG TPA: hypothetical protein VFC39_00220 [Acidobacteriaceae bacterium]|nr:hypothetical protein [Acidobacteriaceae bacterium]